jgi:tetratricopeptide (TPR) repeat protein
LALNLPLIRFSQGCKSSRLGQWVRAGWMLRSKREAQDMEFFRRHRRDAEDPRMARLRENFRANLRDICRAGGPGVPKVLGNVAVNLKDCPPLGSRHRPRLPPADLARWEEAYQRGMAAESAGRWAEAIGHYRAAAAVDDHFAELHYRLARCCLATQDQPGARRHFALARDWDALPFRADARLNEILRQTALELKPWNVRFADVERAFGQSEWSEAGIPGSLLFYEHVHPTFKGTYLLACALLPQVQQALGERLGPPASTPLLSLEACAAELPYTKLDEYNVAGAMAQFIGSPPFLDQLDHDQLSAVAQQTVKNLGAALTQQEIYASLAAYQAAIARRPADWPLRFNLGNLQLQLRQPQAAVEQFAWLAKAYPRIAPLRKSLGSVLANLGKYDEALVELEQAKKLDPDDAELRSVIGQLKERLGR